MKIGNDQKFYKFPVNFKNLLEEKETDKCSEIESIDGHIDLLITTCPGEHSFDKQYGTTIWEMDFEYIVSVGKWKDRFIGYLSESIARYEPRITNCQFKLDITEVEQEDTLSKNVNIHKCVDIYLQAVIKSTEEPCTFHYRLYLSPLSKK